VKLGALVPEIGLVEDFNAIDWQETPEDSKRTVASSFNLSSFHPLTPGEVSSFEMRLIIWPISDDLSSRQV
jgi:hypothetical protein